MKTQKIKGQYRQGDVLLENASMPRNAKKVSRENGRIILAHGEVTGHAHAIEDKSCVLMDSDGTYFLSVPTESPLLHEEHGTITIEKSVKKIRRQSEYDPMTIRRVID